MKIESSQKGKSSTSPFLFNKRNFLNKETIFIIFSNKKNKNSMHVGSFAFCYMNINGQKTLLHSANVTQKNGFCAWSREK